MKEKRLFVFSVFAIRKFTQQPDVIRKNIKVNTTFQSHTRIFEAGEAKATLKQKKNVRVLNCVKMFVTFYKSRDL